MKINCPSCGRVIGDTEQSLDAHINCKRCGQQDIHIRVANFNDYLNAQKGTEDTNDKSE